MLRFASLLSFTPSLDVAICRLSSPVSLYDVAIARSSFIALCESFVESPLALRLSSMGGCACSTSAIIGRSGVFGCLFSIGELVVYARLVVSLALLARAVGYLMGFYSASFRGFVFWRVCLFGACFRGILKVSRRPS